MIKTLPFLLLLPLIAFAQEQNQSIDFFTDILGKKGIIISVGLLFFFGVYRNSIKIFNWIEDQTFGTRDHVLKQFELLFIEVDPQKITYSLLFLSFGLSAIVFSLCALFSNFFLGVVLAIFFSFVGWKIPKPFMSLLVRRRIRKYQDQMVDALTLLANGLRAGLSMPQAIGMIVDEMPDPVSQEFNLVLQQSRIGVPLDEALENLNKRLPLEDNEMFVSSVNILRETGGNLAETFDTIVGVIRERIRLDQKIQTYIAQGLFQGTVIFCMPFGMLLITSISDPSGAAEIFTSPIGIIGLIIAMGFNLAGGWAILKVIKIKV